MGNKESCPLLIGECCCGRLEGEVMTSFVWRKKEGSPSQAICEFGVRNGVPAGKMHDARHSDVLPAIGWWPVRTSGTDHSRPISTTTPLMLSIGLLALDSTPTSPRCGSRCPQLGNRLAFPEFDRAVQPCQHSELVNRWPWTTQGGGGKLKLYIVNSSIEAFEPPLARSNRDRWCNVCNVYPSNLFLALLINP